MASIQDIHQHGRGDCRPWWCLLKISQPIVSTDDRYYHGKLIFGIFASLAEFERDLISERTRAGLAATSTRTILIEVSDDATPPLVPDSPASTTIPSAAASTTAQ